MLEICENYTFFKKNEKGSSFGSALYELCFIDII